MHQSSLNALSQDKMLLAANQKKLLSEWVFPLRQNYSGSKDKRKISSVKVIFNTFYNSNLVIFDDSDAQQTEKTQTKTQDSSVSQKKQYVSTHKNLSNSLYGSFTNKISSKYALVYKKRFNSLDVSNVNELNVTTFKKFEISRPVKPKSDYFATHKQEAIKNPTKFSKLQVNQEKLPKITKIRGQQKSQQLKIGWFDKKYCKINLLSDDSQLRFSKKRKNSICPWEYFGEEFY